MIENPEDPQPGKERQEEPAILAQDEDGEGEGQQGWEDKPQNTQPQRESPQPVEQLKPA